MLRLERLEVSGFKSFPEKTTVEFPDGITAVVGPNGCGKSNVADAIQWVLGEQSARALRGSKMEDVIFNGSQDRGPGGLAEVALHMVARGAALTGGRVRVTLTRRLFRTGESEYLIDGKKARLADVRDLLDEVRAGVRTYAIIDQAQVASFVVSKPKERRVFIEEAAGIASYKNRRRLAEMKLEATRANLLRVDDILREVERQRRSLQRQAGLARRARRIDEEHRALRTYWFATRGRELGRQVQGLAESLDVAQREAGHLEAERARRDARLAEARALLEAAHEGRDLAAQALHKASLDEARLTREIEAAGVRAAALEDEAGRQEGEGRRLEEDRGRREAEVAAQERLLAEVDTQLVEIEAALRDARARADAERGALQQGQSEAQRLEKAHYEALHRRADLAARLSGAREAAVREERRAEESAAAGGRLQAQRAEAAAALAAAEEAQRAAGEEADRQVAAVHEARRAEEDAARQVEESRTDEGRIAAEYGQRAGEKAALESLAVRLAGADAARKMMELAREGRLAARSVIADVVSVDQDVEQAAEAFLGETLPAIVVESADEILKGARLGVEGRVSFLALDAPPNGLAHRSYDDLPHELASDPRVRGRLAARLATQPELDGVVRSRLEDAILVDGLESAIALHRAYPHWNFLTPEGHSVAASGVVRIEGRGEAHRDGLLARARRREQLAREVAELEQRRAAAQARALDARAALAAAQTARQQSEERLAEARRGVATARLAFEQSGREVHRIEREVALAATVHEAAERGRDEARARADALEGQVGGAEHDAEAARTALEEARERVRVREDAARESAGALGGLSAERGARFERRAGVARDLERLRSELRALSERTAQGDEARRRSLAEAERLRAESEAARGLLETAQAARAAAEGEAARWADEQAQRQAEVRAAESHLSEVAGECEGARARRERLALDTGRAQSDFEHLLTTCREELSQEPEDLPAAQPEGIDVELLGDERRLAARIAELRERRDRLGPVNLLAETEFEELTVRWEELTKQREDLIESVDELNGSIRRMDRESRERFLDAFNSVRHHFKEQFAILFRGGRGDLVLEDEENPLDCGIEIMCQPPGKKLQTVSLMSGGEKALTATAVLFSIFKYQAPPFCLLDEVDAPLDDANVGRFADQIRSFAENTQFIMITHNKRTMEMADILYGVTMPEPGVSRLVSMTLD